MTEQDNDRARVAADTLARSWMEGTHVGDLPAECRPRTRAEGYAVQALWPQAVGDRIAGWKIAATSKAGQEHIAVSGPIAGPVFARHVHADGAVLSLAANRMRVAECEIVFRLGRTLGPRESDYTLNEVLAAVEALHPGIEAPDSRFLQFERAGEAQLIADCACMNDMIVGAPVAPGDRLASLASLAVEATVSDGRRPQGSGANVLGDPCVALLWLVNELRRTGRGLEAGQFVTSGACVAPIPVVPGLRVDADFGWLGRVTARFA